jgi:hypothetical protein
LKSGSVWTAALLHGSHNVFMLHVFNNLTTDSGNTWLFLGEYGAITAAIGILLAILFWRLPITPCAEGNHIRREQVTSQSKSETLA